MGSVWRVTGILKSFLPQQTLENTIPKSNKENKNHFGGYKKSLCKIFQKIPHH